MGEIAFVHHRRPGGINVWCYMGIKFWGTPEGWVSETGLFSKTFDGMEDEIRKAMPSETATNR